MAVIQTGNHPKALWPGVKAWFGMQYNKHAAEYPELFDVESSRQNYEDDVLATGFGLAPIKAEGEPLRIAAHGQGWTARYTHVAYALGYEVTKEELDDNLYDKLSRSRAASLAFSMNQTKENVGANVYNRLTNTSYTGGDGSALGVTNHPLKGGGTYANITTAATFSETALEDLLILMMKATDDMGLKISLRGKKLIVPADLAFEAERVLKSTLQNDTANNALNAIRNKGVLPGGYAVNHYLTSTTAYFIRTDCPDGLKCYNRVGVEFDRDNDFHTKSALASAYERYSFGWSNPRSLYANTGA